MPKGDGRKQGMQYPSHEAVGEWLERIEARFGFVYRLMCETVCLTAVRRAEVVGWRTDTLPRNRSEWSSLIANPDTAYEHQTIKAVWPSPTTTDTFDRYDVPIGGITWHVKDGCSQKSLSARRSSW